MPFIIEDDTEPSIIEPSVKPNGFVIEDEDTTPQKPELPPPPVEGARGLTPGVEFKGGKWTAPPSPTMAGLKGVATIPQRAIGNIPSDIINTAKGLMELPSTLYGLATGGIPEEATSAIMDKIRKTGREMVEKPAETAYKGMEAFSEMAVKEPLTTAAMLYGGGGALRGAGEAIATKLPKTAEVLTGVGKGLEAPVQAGIKAVKATKPVVQAVAEAAEPIPKALLKLKYKPMRTVTPRDYDKYEEALSIIGREGAPKYKTFKKELKNIEEEVQTVLKPHVKKPINQDYIFRELEDVRKDAVSMPSRESYLKDVNSTVDEFIKEHGATLNVGNANEIKRNIYKVFEKHYTGTAVKSDGYIDAYQAIASGLKDGIEAAAPEIGALNTKYSELLSISPYIVKAAKAPIPHEMAFATKEGIGAAVSSALLRAPLAKVGAWAEKLRQLPIRQYGVAEQTVVNAGKNFKWANKTYPITFESEAEKNLYSLYKATEGSFSARNKVFNQLAKDTGELKSDLFRHAKRIETNIKKGVMGKPKGTSYNVPDIKAETELKKVVEAEGAAKIKAMQLVTPQPRTIIGKKYVPEPEPKPRTIIGKKYVPEPEPKPRTIIGKKQLTEEEASRLREVGY